MMGRRSLFRSLLGLFVPGSAVTKAAVESGDTFKAAGGTFSVPSYKADFYRGAPGEGDFAVRLNLARHEHGECLEVRIQWRGETWGRAIPIDDLRVNPGLATFESCRHYYD